MPTTEVSTRYLIAKRLFDLAVCFLLLPVVLPLLLLCALAIRLDSPGPIFIAQERTGRDGSPFRMLKFRTMVRNAAELKAELAKQSRGDIMIVVGGVVPPQDYETLKRAGAEAIFPPGTVIAEAAADLVKTLSQRLGHALTAAE